VTFSAASPSVIHRIVSAPSKQALRGTPSRVRLLAAVCAALALFAVPGRAEKIEQLKPQGYVNDFAGVLDAQARERLTGLCQEVEQKAHAQIAIVTVRRLEGVPIEDFSVNLATRWGIGPKASDRGVLILLAVDDHRYRVEVGYGLESILPDGKVGGFGREIVPLLRQRDYRGALLQLTSRIADVIAEDRGVTLGNRLPLPRRQPERPFPWAFTGLIIFFVVWFVWSVFRSLFLPIRGGLRHRGRYGGWPGIWWLGGFGSGGSGGGWSGGSFGGGGGGGFGGFGGGGFGGGGASGSW